MDRRKISLGLTIRGGSNIQTLVEAVLDRTRVEDLDTCIADHTRGAMSAKNSARAFTLRRLRNENIELARRYRRDVSRLKEHVLCARRANHALLDELQKEHRNPSDAPEW